MGQLSHSLSCREPSSRYGEWSRYLVQISFQVSGISAHLRIASEFTPCTLDWSPRPTSLQCGMSSHDPANKIKPQSHVIVSVCSAVDGSRVMSTYRLLGPKVTHSAACTIVSTTPMELRPLRFQRGVRGAGEMPKVITPHILRYEPCPRIQGKRNKVYVLVIALVPFFTQPEGFGTRSSDLKPFLDMMTH
jgi:hypothetical protein